MSSIPVTPYLLCLSHHVFCTCHIMSSMRITSCFLCLSHQVFYACHIMSSIPASSCLLYLSHHVFFPPGVYLWPGGQASIHGHRPSVYATNKSAPFQERVQTAIGWFADGGKDFVALYFNEPDSTGHRYGPASHEVADKVSVNL